MIKATKNQDLGKGVILFRGDCIRRMGILKKLGVQVHAVLMDPPYHMRHMTKRLAKSTAPKAGRDGAFARRGKGFQGKDWDGGTLAHDPATWSLIRDLVMPGGHVVAFANGQNYHRLAHAAENGGLEIRDMLTWLHAQGMAFAARLPGEHAGWRPSLKPALEPAMLARVPLKQSVAKQMAETGTGALNIDACRIGDTGGTAVDATGGVERLAAGRYPTPVMHDGSLPVRDVLGDAAKFYFCAKPDQAERALTDHPTQKPLEFMRYLVRLTTAPGQWVMDPTGGSGTTAVACVLEGRNCLIIERETQYCHDIRARVAAAEFDNGYSPRGAAGGGQIDMFEGVSV